LMLRFAIRVSLLERPARLLPGGWKIVD